MNYDFDTVLSRKNTASIKWDKYQNRDILPFWVADMDFAIAPEIQDALRERMEHPVYGYTRAPDELIESLQAHLHTLYDWSIQEDWLVWIPGVVAALSACCRACLQPGDKLMTNPPIYHHFFQVHDAETNELQRIPLHTVDGRWTFDLEAIEAALTPQTRLLMLCSPHNPVGTVFTHDELAAVCKLAQQNNTIVVSDEIHCGLVLNPDTPHVPTALAAPEYAGSIITLMSQSKTFNLAGMNCSYAIIPDPELRAQFSAAIVEVVPFVTTFAYVSAHAGFTRGEPWRQALLEYLRENYALLAKELNAVEGLSIGPCDATYLAWIDATGLDIDNAVAFFEQHGLGVSDGEQFGQPGFIRFNFACPRETLSEGIRRLKLAVESRKAK